MYVMYVRNVVQFLINTHQRKVKSRGICSFCNYQPKTIDVIVVALRKRPIIWVKNVFEHSIPADIRGLCTHKLGFPPIYLSKNRKKSLDSSLHM